MSLSIIIPIYNVEDFVVECIDSVKNIDSIDYELILIDDGSTDRSYQLIQEKYKTLGNVRIFTQKNSGLANTRNRGLQLARMKYVMFLDSDDLLDSRVLSQCIREMINKNLDVFLFSGQTFENSRYEAIPYHVNYIRPSLQENRPVSGEQALTQMLETNYFCSACMYIYDREKFSEYFFDDVLYEDNLFTSRLLNSPKAKSVLTTQNVVYFRRTRAQSIMTSKLSEKNFDAYQHVIRSFNTSLIESHNKIIQGNYKKLIAMVHSEMTKIIFSIDEWSFKFKLNKYFEQFKYFKVGKYSFKLFIKSLVPFTVILKRFK